MTTNTLERRQSHTARSKPRIEARADAPTAKMIVGYAAVFYDPQDPGTQYRLWDNAVERIMPGAFTAAVKEDDVRGLANHEVTWLLGRTKAGTCRVFEDAIGLRYEIDVPDTQAGRDTLTSLERGDLDGSSFAFDVYGRRGRVQWSEETIDGVSLEVREIHECELFDVGPVAYPAYESTTSGARSSAPTELRGEYEAWKRSQAPADDDFDIDLDLTIAEAEARSRDVTQP